MTPECTISVESEDRGGKTQYFVMCHDHIDNSRTCLTSCASHGAALAYAQMVVKAQNDLQPDSTVLAG